MEQWTALMYAARSGSLDLSRLLLEHGANIHAVQRNQWTALMVAASSGHVDMVQF